MDSGPTGLDTRVKQANKQPKTNTRSKVDEWREMYLEASPMADADDTGICDAVHNVEPKVGRTPVARGQRRDMFNGAGNYEVFV